MLCTQFRCFISDIHYSEQHNEVITIENGNIREYSSSVRKGLGVRVIVDGYQGYASTSRLNLDSVKEAIRKAIEAARALKGKAERHL